MPRKSLLVPGMAQEVVWASAEAAANTAASNIGSKAFMNVLA
jgi:hypothetical protein